MKIQDVEGIGPVFGEKLAAAGVTTTGSLLKAGSSPSGRKALAARSGIEGGKILDWVNHCDLMRVSGVGPEYSDLLEAAGVDTVRELAQRRADNLHAKIIEVNEAKRLVRRRPSQGMIEGWIGSAKELPRGVTY